MENAKDFMKRLKRNLEAIKGGRTNAEMGKIIQKTHVTFSRRLNDPQELTLKEVFLLCKHEGIAIERFVAEELKIQ